MSKAWPIFLGFVCALCLWLGLHLSLVTSLLIGMILTGAVVSVRQFNLALAKEQAQRQLTVAMMEGFSLLKVMILQGMTPYQALQTLLPYVPLSLANAVHQLLMEMDQDTTLQPYLHFAAPFHSIMIEQLLFSLYQLNHQGGQGASLQHFQYLFDQADHQHDQSQRLIYEENLQSANGLVMIATGMIAFSLLVGVMQLIGGMIYGN